MAPSGPTPAGVASVAPVALVVVVPLVFVPSAFGPFHAAKWLAVCVVVPAGLAVCAAQGCLRWPRWKWFLPVIATSLLATVLGVAPIMSVLGSPNRNNGLLALAVGIGAFVLGASVGGDPVVQRRVLRAAFVTGGVVGVLAVAERVGLDLPGVGDAGEFTRARSTWGSATFAGAHLAIVGPIAVAHIRSRDARWRAVAIVSTLAIAGGLLATGTRAAWLAAAVAAAMMVPAWRSNVQGSDQQSATPQRQVLAAAIALVAVAAVAVVAVPQLDRASGVGRFDLWSTAPSVIADAPVIGTGPDSQRVVLPAGIDAGFEAEHGSEELHDRVHSLPLDSLVTGGLLGLIALAAVLWVVGRDIAVALHRRLVPTAVAAGLVGWLVTQLFAFGDPVLDPIPLLLAGVLWVAIVPTGEASAGEAIQGPARGTLAAAIGFAAIAVVGLGWAGGELVAEHRLAAAIDLRDEGDLAGALDQLDGAAAIAPGRFDLDQIAARLVATSLTSGPEIATGDGRAALIEDTLDRLDRAEVVAGGDPEVMMDRAELLTSAGRATEALEAYERVFERYPNSFRAHLGAGLAAVELDDLDAAVSSWTTAAALAPADGRALVNLGILEERRGDPDAAADYFERALDADPEASAAAAGLERVAAAG